MEPSTESQGAVPAQGPSIFAKNKKIITVVVVVIVFALLLFLNSRRATAPVSEEMEQVAPVTLETTPAAPKGPSTLTALLAQNIAQECTYSVTTDGVESMGTVYLANGKMRVDTQVRDQNGTLEKSSMLNDGANMYLWGDTMEEGIKMPIPSAQAENTRPNTPAPVVDPNQEINYNCSPSAPTSDAFVLPSTVTFVDLGAMMQGIPVVPPTGAE